MTKHVIGLTGGIGSGKSAATEAFKSLGISIVDADEVARDVVAVGSEGLRHIVARFGRGILLEDGQLNRPALRERVFSHEGDKHWLNQLLHPLIRAKMLADIGAAPSAYCILSVPLLIENNMENLCDRVIVVDCPESLQLSRALQRDGSSRKTIESIMASQASRNERLEKADDVINNTGSLDELHEQVALLHEQYVKHFNLSA
ncbi:MAG TPA: dephospho-CoA kinase [Alteromonas australica]|uniref:Dephospho-CoA kinase n=1 Tax=Alteromonas australica TaxID=589873 RepID=A0A350P9G6_9ALTE|nr:dephospho-CoA kinase [Alteromonas australica]MBU32685.1 dephospho-CoA kinase [Alteromonas sp.]HAW77933.1 dephospho-CoA kinase [Alteromonas australica]HBU51911.1 dephospho-CoA kinase [Alteromonas australica]|tara:strand:- start:8907 stop:9515 length:609 start_codon:yes stop_codon:yes gene_type:complete